MPDEASRDKIELKVAGRVHSGWTEAEVSIGIDSLAGSFDLSLSDSWPADGNQGADIETRIVEAGSEASILVGGEQLITGYIDQVIPTLSAEQHDIRIAGRSKAADLLDCSAIHKPGSWSNRRFEDIAADLARPFGIAVTAEVSTGEPFKTFALQPGETVFQAIERMGKMRGLLAVSRADGSIAIIRPQISGSAIRLQQGRDFLSITARHDVSERFSEYLVKGQARGDDAHNGKAVAHPKGTANDIGVKRYRPLLVVAEDQASAATAKERAEWEAKVRAAKSQGCEVTMQGWRTPAGNLWLPGATVDLIAPAALITAKLVIVQVTYRIDPNAGSTAMLSLAYPEAYAAIPGEEADAARMKKKAA
ncbi:MAG: phage baseplate assembly protein [Sphingorhabdus sp.]